MEQDNGRPGGPSQAEPKVSALRASVPDAGGMREVTDLAGFLSALGTALAPRFEAQDTAWATHGPAALERCAAAGIELGTYGGNCPVQVEGGFEGLRFYFRARGEGWQFHVAKSEADIFDNDLFYIERDYGEGPFDAGWMDLHEALHFVCAAVAEFRAQGIEARRAETGTGSVHESPVPQECAPTHSENNQ